MGVGGPGDLVLPEYHPQAAQVGGRLAPAEPSALRLVATLTLAGLGAGLLLASVYAVTLPTIEANAREELQRAVDAAIARKAA